MRATSLRYVAWHWLGSFIEFFNIVLFLLLEKARFYHNIYTKTLAI